MKHEITPETGEISLGFRQGLIAGFPIVIGYFPVAMAFGLLAKTICVSLMDSFCFSVFVFAGASQFMALDLIKSGISAGSIILATFLLNLRHFMMSASMSIRLTEMKKNWLPFVAFGITDETFSVASLEKGRMRVSYLLTLEGVSYGAWVSGTLFGYLIGSFLPAAVQNSLGVGLYAMFTAILVPEIQRSFNVLCLAGLSGIVYLAIDHFRILPSGWGLIAAIVAASGIGVWMFKDKDEAREGQE